jgi:uncharacterized repeat protein (TIGR03803 family)
VYAIVLLSVLALAASAPAQTQLFSFPCPTQQFSNCSDGYDPNALIQASDGNFYGAAQLTTQGTSNPHGGTLFKITPSGQFTLLFTFSKNSSGQYLNGDNPASGLVEANDGFIYGTSFEGGSNNDGVLFRIQKTGKNFSVVHTFCSSSNCADGISPGGLILGRDGSLYGTTFEGGSNNSTCAPLSGCGTIFKFTPPSTFTTLFEFDGSSTQGAGPGGMIQGTDGNFYGVAGNSVFQFTSAGQLNLLETFPKVDGFLPTSGDSGLVQAANGNLYGGLTTYSMNQVQFYSISPSGSGFTEYPSIGTLAIDFRIGNMVQASDGNLWTAFNQVSAGDGSIIAFSPVDGSVVQNFSFSGSNGATPEAGVIQGADGKIYGTTLGGGTVAQGQQASGTVWVLDAGLAPPIATIAAFTPTSGSVGAKVTIRGSNFVGTTAVTFNGVAATFKVLNRSFISATVPVAATTGPIAVTNAGGTTTSTRRFKVQ